MLSKGPIPGENFTSDTKNYPWHQPPEYRNLAEALDKMAVKLTDPKMANKLVALAEMGFPLVQISQLIVTEGIGQGKWTVDMGLLLAGPFTKIIEIMCDSYGVEYNLGIEEKDDFRTGAFFKGLNDLDKYSKNSNVYKVVKEDLPQIKAEAEDQATPEAAGPEPKTEEDLQMSGFAAMTGDDPEEEEVV